MMFRCTAPAWAAAIGLTALLTACADDGVPEPYQTSSAATACADLMRLDPGAPDDRAGLESGAIDRAERAFGTWDRDGDRGITRAEFAACSAQRRDAPEQTAKIFEDWDGDHDGVITREDMGLPPDPDGLFNADDRALGVED